MEWLAKFFGHAEVGGIEAMAIKGLQALSVMLAAYLPSRALQRALGRRIRHDSGARPWRRTRTWFASTNYTYRDPVARICTFGGVSYSSDLKKVREVLEQSANALPGRDDSHAAQVLLLEFGASSVNYRVCVWA